MSEEVAFGVWPKENWLTAKLHYVWHWPRTGYIVKRIPDGDMLRANVKDFGRNVREYYERKQGYPVGIYHKGNVFKP